MSEREYIKLVLADFEQKLDNKLLPLELVSPTRKSLKKHSYNICLQRFDAKDELLLRSFFGPRESAGAYANAIDLSSAEKFRTLHNFLSDRTESTDFININLLAWLIDFQPRPYRSDLNIAAQPVTSVQPDSVREQANIKGIDIAGGQEDDADLNKEEVVGRAVQEKAATSAVTVDQEIEEPPVPPEKKTDRRWFIGSAILLIGGALIWQLLPTNNNCMYWNDDHYVATSCSVPRLDTPLVHFDPAKLRGFRRLHHVDTLTYYSVNKLWYVRVGGIIEVYSAGGKHPLYPGKKLSPLTYYAVNVCKKQHEY